MKTLTKEEFVKKYGEVGLSQLGEAKTSNIGEKTSLNEKASGFAKGLVKGGIESTVQTSRMIQGLGQRFVAAVDPTRNLDEIREETGFRSLQGDEAEQIDELLKADNTAEKAGKLSAFIASIFVPSGSRAVAQKGASAVANTVGKVADDASQKVGAVADTTGDVFGMVKDSVSRLPSRIGTNFAEKKATREIVKSLPTITARKAVLDGIDANDVKFVYNLPKSQRPSLRKLVDAVKKFSAGETKTNPIEIVGKPITNRVKQLEALRGKVGQKLGAISEKLGEVTTKDVYPKVFENLKKVNGLNGLKVSKKGVLDFTDTVLTTAETKADRIAIQRIFTDAVKKGTGKQKHLLRQELFEALGGKKKSLSNLTDTQEKAYEAIRKGLSDVLEAKNGQYKSLSNEYRKIVQPMADLRKFMKNVAGADDDILDMTSGLLARRLTSNAASNPQIRAILRALDNASKIKGKTQLNVESLQDFYNILDKYYDIAAKTGFKGQVKAGIEAATGPIDFAMKQIGSIAGETVAVRQKALEKIMEEVLGR